MKQNKTKNKKTKTKQNNNLLPIASSRCKELTLPTWYWLHYGIINHQTFWNLFLLKIYMYVNGNIWLQHEDGFKWVQTSLVWPNWSSDSPYCFWGNLVICKNYNLCSQNLQWALTLHILATMLVFKSWKSTIFSQLLSQPFPVCPYTLCPVWRYFTKIWTTTMSWIYIKKYSMNFDQTLQRHGRGIELSKNNKILVTFDLHSRSHDPRWDAPWSLSEADVLNLRSDF